MTQVIYRYPVELNEDGRFMTQMPLGARILHIDTQDRAPHEPSMWAIHDRAHEDQPVDRHFVVVGTGHEHEHLLASQYVGTWQHMGFVWHVFEELGPYQEAVAEPLETVEAA